MPYSSSHAWENPLRSSEQGGAESDAVGQDACKEKSSKGHATPRKLRSTPRGKASENSLLCHAVTPEKGTMRSAMEHEYPDN